MKLPQKSRPRDAAAPLVLLCLFALALPSTAQAQGLRPMQMRYSEPAITFQPATYLRDSFEGPAPTLGPMWRASYQQGGVYTDGLGGAVLDAGTMATPPASDQVVGLFSSSTFSVQSFSVVVPLHVAPMTSGDRCMAVGVGDWALGPGPQTAMALFLCDPGEATSDEAAVFLLTGAPGQDTLQDSVDAGLFFPLGAPFPDEADAVVLSFDFALTDTATGEGLLTATVSTPDVDFTQTLAGSWDPASERVVGILAGISTSTDPAQATPQTNTLALTLDEVWSTFQITPNGYVASLAPFELNGLDYDGRGLLDPQNVAELFLDSSGDPDPILTDGAAIHADGVTNYAVALVTTTFGPRVSVITPLTVADLLSFPEVASVDGYYPDVFLAQGYGYDYLVDLPPLTDIMCSCPTPATTVAEMKAYVQGLSMPSNTHNQLLNKLSAMEAALNGGSVAEMAQRVHSFVVQLQSAVYADEMSTEAGNRLLESSGALLACLRF